MSKEELFEASMSTMDDVMKASQEVMTFCAQMGADRKTAMMTSLFVEEMAGNTVQHGFLPGKPGCVDLRLICHEGSRVIRLRDNGMPFDPVAWYERNHPEDPASGIGIRIIIGLTKDVQYIPAMGLNSFMVMF